VVKPQMIPAVLLLLAGCTDPSRPVPLSGTVTLGGVPVAGAVVVFTPEQGKGRSALAWTDAQGRFDLTTFQGADGVLRGRYVVTITKETSEGNSSNSTPDQLEPSAGRSKNLLPAIYADVTTTPLACVVPPERPVVFELRSEK
jgi:hypothetical protein